MKIISDGSGFTVNHMRVVLIEDGPVVDAGTRAWGSQYKPGTLMRVEAVYVTWENDDTDNSRIRVTGHRINKGGGTSTIPHELRFGFRHAPEWLNEILTPSHPTREEQ